MIHHENEALLRIAEVEVSGAFLSRAWPRTESGNVAEVCGLRTGKGYPELGVKIHTNFTLVEKIPSSQVFKGPTLRCSH